MNKKILLIISVILTCICGVIGFYLSFSTNLFDCLYATVLLFFMNPLVSANEMNLYLKIARWMAMFVSAQAVFLVIENVFKHFKSKQVIKDENLVVLHGDRVQEIKHKIKNSIVFDHETLWNAKRHLLSFNEDTQMMEYLAQNASRLSEDKKIYLMSSSITRNDFQKDSVVVCNTAEMCARIYWQKFPLLFEEEKIVFIGDGDYMEEILEYAILLNILKVNSEVEYHVFTKDTSYLLRHYNLSKCMGINQKVKGKDSLFMHTENWMESRELLEHCDRIVLCDEEEKNMMVLNMLKRDYHNTSRIDIRYSYKEMIQTLWGEDIHVFGSDEDTLNEEIILNDKASYFAKKIHSLYFGKHVCVNKETCHKDCVKCDILNKDWNKLNQFLHYSNIAQADHMPQKIRILEHMKKEETQTLKQFYASLSEEELLELDEIEHIRWERYHYFHNWEYGSIRNNAQRKHPLLVPFEKLTYEEKIKDRDTWVTALELMKYLK